MWILTTWEGVSRREACIAIRIWSELQILFTPHHKKDIYTPGWKPSYTGAQSELLKLWAINSAGLWVACYYSTASTEIEKKAFRNFIEIWQNNFILTEYNNIKRETVPQETRKISNKTTYPGFPGGAVVKNLPANAGDMGSSPSPGRSHMPQSN